MIPAQKVPNAREYIFRWSTGRTLLVPCSVLFFGGRERGIPSGQKNIEGVYMGLKIV